MPDSRRIAEPGGMVMSIADLLVLYTAAGLACAVAIFLHTPRTCRSSARFGAALLAVPLWPLWAPVALSRPRPKPRPSTIEHGATHTRIEAALHEAVEAARGTPLQALLPDHAAQRILEEVQRVESRCQELTVLLSRPDFDVELARERIRDLDQEGASARVLATARLQLENAERLQTMLNSDRRALLELSELIAALRTQLVLARYAGSSAEGVGGIVSEVWSRVEGLDEAMEAHDVSPDPAEE